MTVCKRCIMSDKADPTITFNENGYCNYCETQIANIGKVYFPNEIGQEKLNLLVEQIKSAGKGKKYDCIMGLSGGLDSSYLLYLGHKLGLRIFGVHIDDGFDTDISKENLRKLVETTGIHYEVITPDSKQFNALTKAYMRAGVPNLAIPQDNVLLAFIYDCMKKNGIKYFLSGGNFALECVLQKGNTHSSLDLINLRDIHRRFGELPITNLKFISSYQKYLDMKLRGIQSPRPLDYIDYNRERAFKELYEFCGFEYYGRKHLENKLTAFIQLYWLPKKFGVDKRTSHLSSMIVSNQLSREDALKEMEEPLYDENLMDEYIAEIKAKLCISDEEFEEMMNAPTHQHTDYKYDKKDQYIRKIVR